MKRSFVGRREAHVSSYENATGATEQDHMGVNMLRKSKLLIVDLAGSERINKSGKLLVEVDIVIFCRRDKSIRNTLPRNMEA